MKELNLLPYGMKDKRKKNFLYKQYIGIGIIILCVLFIGIYFPMGKLSRLKTKEAALEQQVKTYEVMIDKGQKMKLDIDNLNKYVNKVKELTDNKIIVADKIRGLQAFLPKDLSFNSLSYTDGAIAVNGQATKYASISELTANLQMSTNYSNAKISNITHDKINNTYSFALIIK